MSKRRDADYLLDLQEAIHRIGVYIADMTYEQFMEDIKTQDAVVRNLEVMGEATKRLSRHLREAYPTVPWKDLSGVRDKMIHHYFGINYDIVWTIVKDEVPLLVKEIKAIISGWRE